MKKRRTLIVSLLLVAALALGIGYASFADELLINGQMNFDPQRAEDEFIADVYFTENAKAVSYCTAGRDNNDGEHDTVYMHIGGQQSADLAAPGQQAVAIFEIQNDYESPVTVSFKSAVCGLAADNTTNLDTLFTITTKFHTEQLSSDYSDEGTIDPGEVGYVTVIIEPKDIITQAITNGTIVVTLEATAVTTASNP